MKLRPETVTEKDYEQLLKIWEASVKATHDFLDPADLEALKTEIPTFLPLLQVTFWLDGNEVVGFSGTQSGHLEMLFLDPTFFHQGYGNVILKQLIKDQDVRFVDVNQDNLAAKHFYEKNGFELIDVSPLDGQGRPYPIEHRALVTEKG